MPGTIHLLRMTNCRLILLCLALVGGLTPAARGQDPHFSQYYAAPLHLNPALAALEKNAYVGLNYRNQWRSLGFPQKTGQLAAILPVQTRRGAALGGIGIGAYNDVLGENNSFRTTGASLSLSRALYDNAAHVVAAGLQAGVTGRRLDASGLQWGSQYDPSVGYNAGLAPATDQLVNQKVFPVVHAGLLWHYNHFRREEDADWSLFAGLSLGNLNRPDEALLGEEKRRLPVLYKLHGGVLWRVTPKVGIAPNWLVMRQNGTNQVNAGAYANYSVAARHQGKSTPLQVSLGGWYRMGDAFIVSAGSAFKNYTVGFSYDVNVSSLRYGTGGRGAYEFSMAYRFLRGNTIRRYSTPLM